MNGEVKASDLYKFCRVPYQTFQDWARSGWFGDRKRSVGEGNERSYGFMDVLLARVLADLSMVTRSKTFAFESDGKSLVMDLREGLAKHYRQGNVPHWLTLTWDNEARSFVVTSWFREGAPDLETGRASATVVLPFRKLFSEVEEFFQDNANE